MAESIVRWTKQMKTIMDIVHSSNVHLTADEIFLESKKTLPNISLGTVYRNLKRLSAEGLISVVPKGQVNTFSKHHDGIAHFECDKCHKLFCVAYADFGLNISEMSKKSGFHIRKCLLSMSGTCRECVQKRPADSGPQKPGKPSK